MALPQIARPDDIAHLVVFLSSDRLARHVTGQTIVVAGGMECRWLWQPDQVDPTLAYPGPDSRIHARDREGPGFLRCGGAEIPV